MHFLSCHLLTAQSPLLARILQFPIARRVDLGLPPCEHILRRDVADGAVQANVVVMLDIPLNQTSRIIEGQRRSGPDGCNRRMSTQGTRNRQEH
jgi:hypothetical protein